MIKKLLLLILPFVIIACYFLLNGIFATDEYKYSLNQYQDPKPINPIFIEGNKALFGEELTPGKQDVKLEMSIRLKKSLIHKNANVEGNGNLLIDGTGYPIFLTAGNLEKHITNETELLFGSVDGYMYMNGKKVKLAMSLSTIPNSKKSLISITFATPSKGIPALVFGEPFSESTDFLSKLNNEK